MSDRKPCDTCQSNRGKLCAHDKAQIRHPDGTYELNTTKSMIHGSWFMFGECAGGKLWELKS